LRAIIIIVEVGGVKNFVAKVEALKKKEKQGESHFITKIDGFLSFTPPPLEV
jgi:hypothetical protein